MILSCRPRISQLLDPRCDVTPFFIQDNNHPNPDIDLSLVVVSRLGVAADAVSRPLARTGRPRVHLVVSLALELLVQDTSCGWSEGTGMSTGAGHVLRSSYPNSGYSRQSERNSSSASARRVWLRVAQKCATGSRIVTSSLGVKP